MTSEHETLQSLLAAYALDAVDVDEALQIETHLDTCPECAAALAQLRETVDLLATLPAAVPLPALRSETVAAALARRGPRPVTLTAPDLHLIESTRVLDLLAALPPADWRTPIGPTLPDWNVQDLAAHLVASDAVLAETLGVEPFTPETDDQPTPRTHPIVARHRTLGPRDTLAELEQAYTATQDAVRRLGPDAPEQPVTWLGINMTLGQALTQRAFEIWTHADDIRAAVGLPLVPPPAPSLAAMSATALETVPILLAAAGVDAEGRRGQITLTGPGGGTYELDLGLEGRPTPAEPEMVLELDVVDFCRGLADRLPAADTRYGAQGDLDLAEALVAALPGLAIL